MDFAHTTNIVDRVADQVDLRTETDPSQMLANARVNLKRDLPAVQWCKRHDLTLTIAAGGPSLADTYTQMDGYIAAINGSLKFLCDHGITPNACGVLDPGAHMTEIVQANPDVRYFVASICAPSLFDKLLNAGCSVVIWHPSGDIDVENAVKDNNPDGWMAIGGATTMGLRWLNLGYVLGFRKFVIHGLDSSFRDGATHAYPDRKDAYPPIEINGYQTRLNFLQQVSDFSKLLPRFTSPKEGVFEACDIELRGDGLMQSCWRSWKERGEKSTAEAFCTWD